MKLKVRFCFDDWEHWKLKNVRVILIANSINNGFKEYETFKKRGFY